MSVGPSDIMGGPAVVECSDVQTFPRLAIRVRPPTGSGAGTGTGAGDRMDTGDGESDGDTAAEGEEEEDDDGAGGVVLNGVVAAVWVARSLVAPSTGKTATPSPMIEIVVLLSPLPHGGARGPPSSSSHLNSASLTGAGAQGGAYGIRMSLVSVRQAPISVALYLSDGVLSVVGLLPPLSPSTSSSSFTPLSSSPSDVASDPVLFKIALDDSLAFTRITRSGYGGGGGVFVPLLYHVMSPVPTAMAVSKAPLHCILVASRWRMLRMGMGLGSMALGAGSGGALRLVACGGKGVVGVSNGTKIVIVDMEIHEDDDDEEEGGEEEDGGDEDGDEDGD